MFHSIKNSEYLSIFESFEIICSSGKSESNFFIDLNSVKSFFKIEPTNEFFLCLLFDLKVLLSMLGLEFDADFIVTKESDSDYLLFYGVAYLFDFVDFSDFIMLSTIKIGISLFYSS